MDGELGFLAFYDFFFFFFVAWIWDQDPI